MLIDQFHRDLQEQNLAVEIDNYFFDEKNGEETTTLKEDKYFKEMRWISPEFIYGSDTISNMANRDGNVSRYIEEVLKKIFVQRPGYEDVSPEDYGMKSYRNIHIPDLPNISSSLARERIITSQSVDWILSPEIAKMIQEYKMYRNNKVLET